MNSIRLSPMSYQFPAILIAGTPNCGKSVLSFMLTQHLCKMGIDHYLLRTAPDGEGNWFLQGDPAIVRTLREKHKGAYTSEFVAHMKSVIENRLVPLLVDVGGLPRGEQFGIVRACTHAVLLYKDEEGRAFWSENLHREGVPLIAELRSTLHKPGKIEGADLYLQGTISGLKRENPQPDMTFGALSDRVAGLCHTATSLLEHIHLRHAQYPPVVEQDLMMQIDASRAKPKLEWRFSDLPRVAELVPPNTAVSLYGRGTVWLAAMIGTRAGAAPMTIYDIRYGWIPVPEVFAESEEKTIIAEIDAYDEFDWVELSIPGSILEPGAIQCSPIEAGKGIILSGKLPRWAFAALARWLAPKRDWVAINDAKMNAAVVVHSNLSDLQPGMTITKPVHP